MDTNGDRMIDLDEWMKFTHNHKRIMLPLIKAQSNVRHRIMGINFWKRQMATKENTMRHLLQVNMHDKDITRALHANCNVVVGDEDDHAVHSARSFRADETLVPFQTAPRPKEASSAAYHNTLTSKETERKVQKKKEKEKEGSNPYAYRPKKKEMLMKPKDLYALFIDWMKFNDYDEHIDKKTFYGTIDLFVHKIKKNTTYLICKLKK